VYLSALTTSSQKYARTGCNDANYYYEAIEVKVIDSGMYSFRSNSLITTYGYIYNDTFTPFDPIVNLHSEAYERCFNGQFKLTIVLQANITYTLVVTTYSSNVTGAFSIIVSGLNYVSFNRIREYLYYLVNNQHIIHKMFLNSIFHSESTKKLQNSTVK
jgi:hypothetical protein